MNDSLLPAPCDVVLRDGSTLLLRPLQPGDEAALRDFYEHLSLDTVHARFMVGGLRSDLVPEKLPVPQPAERLALVGELGARLWALGEYVRDPGDPTRAEVAFLTADVLQGRGVGTLLLERLADAARAVGIDTFDASVADDNRRMMRVFLDSGFDVEERLSGGLYHVSLALNDSLALRHKLAERGESAATASMRAFFTPTGVAVVGASRTPGTIGFEILHNIRATGYTGALVAINPHAQAIDGVSCHASLATCPEAIELAVIVTPAEFVSGVIDEALAHGVRAVLVISAGFGETGAAGRRAELALVDKVRRAGVRMIGPNCMGLVNTDRSVRLNATFAPSVPPEGSVAFLSQSGALGLAILEFASRLNIGISTFVSVGNTADVSSPDLLQFWASDDRTRVILLYLESFANAASFVRVAARVSRRKPVVAVKSGRSRAGARAAASHTGALAASDRVVEGILRQTGVIRVETLEELFDVAALAAHQPLPAGRRLAIVTNAGGPGIMAADRAEAEGLVLASLSDATLATLRAFLPPTASLANPVDMIASASPDAFRRTVAAVLDDPNVDAVIVIYIPPLVTAPEDVAAAIRTAHTAAPGKTLLATFMTAQGMNAQLDPVPCFTFPESAASALAHLVRYAGWRARPEVATVELDAGARTAVRAIIDCCLARGGGWLRPTESADVLAAIGVDLARSELVQSAAEAGAAVARIGAPVALKAVGPEIVHKTDVGGVRLDLKTPVAVETAFDDVLARLGPRMTGAIVQAMVPGAIEALIGIADDASFGSVVLCGAGGTMVELLDDVSARVPPLSPRDAEEMCAEIGYFRVFEGYRGAAPVDAAAFRHALVRIGALAAACPEILEADLNPVKVLGRGVTVVDARFRVGTPAAGRGRRIVYR